MELSAFQQRAVAVPFEFNLFLPGGRNSGKTIATFVRLALYGQQFPESQMLFVRRSYPSLRQPYEVAQSVFRDLGIPIDPNKSEMTIRFPATNSTLTFGPLPDRAYYEERWRGTGFQVIAADELASWVEGLYLIDLLTSNLRHPSYPCSFVGCSNPGPGAHHLLRRWIAPSRAHKPGAPFPCEETANKLTVVLPSTLIDNPHAGADAEANLLAACGGNKALYEQSRHGLFEAVEGALWTLRQANFVEWPTFDPAALPHIRFLIGHDHGSRSPFASIWLARFRENALGPDNTMYPAGSYVAFAETHSADPDSGYTKAAQTVAVSDIAGRLITDAELHNFARPPTVFADDQVLQDHGMGSLQSEYKAYGLPVRPARKGRIAVSIARISELLSGAAEAGQREVPGLYIDPRMTPFLTSALTNAPADPRDAELIDASYPLKHATDALAYGLIANTTPVVQHYPNALSHGGTESHIDRVEREYRRAARGRYAVGRCRITRH